MEPSVRISAYDAMKTRPRLLGDGMDSASLAVSSAISENHSKPTSSQRHRSLKASTKAATIAKSQKPKFVPKEPVKGAVGPTATPPRTISHSSIHSAKHASSYKTKPQNQNELLPQMKPNTYNTQSISLNHGRTSTVSGQNNLAIGQPRDGYLNQSLVSSSQVLRNLNSSMINSHTVRSATPSSQIGILASSSQSSLATLKPKPKVLVDSYHAMPSSAEFCVQKSWVEPSLTENSLKFKQTTSPPLLRDVYAKPSTSDVRIDMNTSDSHSTAHQSFDVLSFNDIIGPPDEERQVEGDLSDGQDEIENLKRELGDLSRVNADLKKLLVASVGEDLHWKMDALVRTKTQLAQEIGGYTEKMRSDYEELDKLSIQADMWRSKFMATRVLIDQLSQEKEEFAARWDLAQTALQQILQERQQLHDNMVETHRYMKFLRDSLDPVYSRKPAPMVPNILELARTNLLLGEEVKAKLLGDAPVLAAALDAGIQNGLSPAEKLAYQVLMSELNTRATGAVPGRLSAQVVSKLGRFHPQVRYEGFTYTCCSHCTGEVQVV